MDVIDGDWIRARLSGRHGEKADLARFMGVKQDIVAKILAGNRRVQPHEAPKVVEFFQSERGEDGPADVGPVTETQRLLPVYDVDVSAGPGAYVEAENHIANMAFDPRYLREIDASKELSIVRVKGESMEPTLVDNDIVLVDHSKRSLNWDGLFVLRYGDATQVKRIGRSGKRDHVTILSDNRDLYPPVEAAVEDVDVVGKVLWYGRKV